MTRPAALVAAIVAAGAWLLAGLLAGLDYGAADAGTRRAEAPDAAVAMVLYLPVAGAALLIGAAALRWRSRQHAARLCARAAAISLVAWVIARLVLTGY